MPLPDGTRTDAEVFHSFLCPNEMANCMRAIEFELMRYEVRMSENRQVTGVRRL